MEMTNWKTGHKHESWGQRNFGIEIRVAIDREFTPQDSLTFMRIADELEDKLMRETVRLDPEELRLKEEQRAKLMECFGNFANYADEIPNGYCSRWCCSMKPWYRVTTHAGIITLGWRKRVISIEWDKIVGKEAEELFPNEDVTKIGHLIHAYGYAKAKAYISVLLGLQPVENT